jgi:hypothetical protein
MHYCHAVLVTSGCMSTMTKLARLRNDEDQDADMAAAKFLATHEMDALQQVPGPKLDESGDQMAPLATASHCNRAQLPLYLPVS